MENGKCLLRVSYVIDALLEHLAIPPEARAMIHRTLEALGQLQTIRRASFRAQIAKHAARRVEGEGGENLLLVHLFAFADFASYRADLDAIDRASKRA